MNTFLLLLKLLGNGSADRVILSWYKVVESYTPLKLTLCDKLSGAEKLGEYKNRCYYSDIKLNQSYMFAFWD